MPQISGDGRLAQSASIPGSGQSTRFDSLEVYLVSYETSLNLTVSQGPTLLTQESGSTVKHINWLIDSCVASGNYNVRIVLMFFCPWPMFVSNCQRRRLEVLGTLD